MKRCQSQIRIEPCDPAQPGIVAPDPRSISLGSIASGVSNEAFDVYTFSNRKTRTAPPLK
jgi:hypothetical protein